MILTDCGIGCDPAILGAGLQIIQRKLHSVLGDLLHIPNLLVCGGRLTFIMSYPIPAEKVVLAKGVSYLTTEATDFVNIFNFITIYNY